MVVGVVSGAATGILQEAASNDGYLMRDGHRLEMMPHDGPSIRPDHAQHMRNTAIGLRIRSTTDDWFEEFEDYIRDYLDVHEQILIQLPNVRQPPSQSCPNILEMYFESSRLRLRRASCRTTTNSIYGIRCRLCPDRSGYANVTYVGKNEVNGNKSYCLHNRICIARRSDTVQQIANRDLERNRPLIEHIATHYGSGQAGRSPNEAFRNAAEVIILPSDTMDTDQQVRNWELFWQWFLHARRNRGGFSQR